MPDDSQMDLFAASPGSPAGTPPARRFLDWSRPLLEQAAEALLAAAGESRPFDLSHLLVVVPTRNSGRRLREMLANLAHARGTAVIPPLAVPPSVLTSAEAGAVRLGRPIAGDLEASVAWIDLLCRIDLEDFRALFPLSPPAQDFRWARSTARDFTALRRTLGEAGLGLGDVARRLPEGHEEAERWRDLARLESEWFDILSNRLGRCDREMARSLAARNAADLPSGIREVMVIGTPDPFPLAIDALGNLAAGGVPITVMIYAPESLAPSFDEWGRPLADYWLKAPLEIPDFNRTARVAANPDDLIGRVVAMVSDLPAPEETLAIGAVDADLAPLLELALQERGIPAFNPEGGRVRQEGFHHLLQLMGQLLERPVFEPLRELLRTPEIDSWLGTRIDRWNSRDALRGLDESHQAHLATRLPEVRTFLLSDAAKKDPRSEWKSEPFTMAASAVSEIIDLSERIRSGPLSQTLPAALSEVVGSRRLDGPDGLWVEKVIEAAAPVMMEALDQLSAVSESGIELDIADQMTLLVDLVGEAALSEDRPSPAIELQGWLELLWEDAPHLIVAGLNDGIVPEAIVGDAYLPENLRKLRTLRLKTNDDRLVRDLYLLRALFESRRDGGRIDLLVQKTTADGDPLRPSRLLFRCDDADLPGRVAHLFQEVEAPGTQASWSPGFTLVPGLERPGAPEKPVTSIAVTAFSSYLSSPFHFWAEKLLRISEVDADKAEMDDLDFGNFCHEVLECFGKDPTLRVSTDPDEIADFFNETADRFSRDRFGKKPCLAVRIQVEAAKLRLAEAARHEAIQRQNGWEIIGVEVQLRDAYPLSLGGIDISGKIDRVERNGGRLRVLDYKTSDKKKPSRRDHLLENRLGEDPEWPPPYALFEHADFSPRSQNKAAAVKSYRFQNLQLPLYALAIAGVHPEAEIHCGYFHLTKALGDVGPDDWVADPDLIAAARVCAEGVIADVVAGKYHRVRPPTKTEFDSLYPLHLGAPDRTLELSHLGGGDHRAQSS